MNIVRPLFPDFSEFKDDFENSLRTGLVTNNSPWVQQFEKDIAAYLNVKYCSAVVNGEIALLLMLKASEIKGSVLVPSYTFSGTIHALMWNQLEPIFVDIDRDTLTIDCSDLISKIKSDTSAILAVPMYGNPCENEQLEKISNQFGLKLFFDSAPAFGSQYKGRKIGNFGVAESFSFHATKVFSTMEGGAVTTNDENIYEKICLLRNFGQHAECNCYDFGINGKMTEICALIGIKNLPNLDKWINRRNEIISYFSGNLNEISGVRLQKISKESISNHLYLFILINEREYGLSRDELFKKFDRKGINARKFFCNPVHKMKCYEKYSDLELPNTDHASKNGLSLPLYSDMSFEEVDCLLDVLKSK